MQFHARCPLVRAPDPPWWRKRAVHTVVPLIVIMLGRAGPAQSQRCRPMDAHAAEVLAFLVDVATRDTAGSIAWRDSLGLDRAHASEVGHVTSETVCAEGAARMAARAGIPDTSAVLAFKVGSHYFIEHPEVFAGEFRLLAWFDRRWNYLGAIASP